MSVRGIRLRYFALVLALLTLAGGIYLVFFEGRGYVQGEATIVSIEESALSTPDDTDYDVTVKHTVDGKEYVGLLGFYSPSYKVGDRVGIRYDPADPTRIVTSSKLFPIVLIAISLLILAVVIVSWVRGATRTRDLKAKREVSNDVVYAPRTAGPERELYFLTDLGTPKFGHRIEDRNRRVLFEAKMTKYTIASPFGFDFIDHEHNKTTPHLVGHTESTEWDSLLLDNHYTFTFDGEFIWKHLKRSGVTVESTLGKDNPLKVSYRIFRDSVLIATAEAASKYVHEEDAEAHKVAGAIPVKGFYRIHTDQTNLDLLFVVLMAFARTEATDDRGGNYKTYFNTIKGK